MNVLPATGITILFEQPAMNDYLEVRFQPLVKPELKKESASPLQPLEIKLTLNAANVWQPTATKM